MNLLYKFSIILFTISILTGCLYPEQELAKNKIPYKSHVQEVQLAVESYQKDSNGLLPIKTLDMKTPKYRKYIIDFKHLTPRYIAEAPDSAYESGGNFIYVIVDAQTKPAVKLIDLHTIEQIREINLKMHQYLQIKKYPPFNEVVANGVFSLNFKELGYKVPPHIKSPFTGNNLPIVIDGDANIYVDYRIDLYDALKKKDQHGFKQGDDIRDLLVEDSLFVPAYSLPYTVDDKNEPIFLLK